MKNRLYGIGEPAVVRLTQDNIPLETTVAIMDALGAGSWREWMHIPELLSDPVTPRPDRVALYTKALDLAAAADIEVTGMSHVWFLPEGCIDKSGCSVPPRDLTPGSLYMQMLEMLETSWTTLVGLFPQVTMWEIGNEWNISPFLHVDGYYKNGMTEKLTIEQAADISLDLMYWSARGIRKANPAAKVVSMSPCPMRAGVPEFLPSQYGIAYFLEMLYSRIASGAYWSKRTDDYFDVVAWHPYDWEPRLPDGLWGDFNDAAYRVMQKYGDGGKKVLLTEFGYTDSGDKELEELQVKCIRRIYEMCAARPYIHSLHYFRLFEDFRAETTRKSADWGGAGEVYFGLFREPENGLTPRGKALEFGKLTGSTADLWQFRCEPSL